MSRLDPPLHFLGHGQTWVDVKASRAPVTSYQNTTGRPIAVSVNYTNAIAPQRLEISADNVTWIALGQTVTAYGSMFGVVPPGHYYRVTQTAGTTTINYWAELS